MCSSNDTHPKYKPQQSEAGNSFPARSFLGPGSRFGQSLLETRAGFVPGTTCSLTLPKNSMRIEITADDDDRFIEIVHMVIETVAHRDTPGTLRVIRVDNWFGEK